MFSSVMSGAIYGIDSYIVNVEADISDGMPAFDMVGFLGYEVREARERVKTALKNLKISLPPKRITINLSPADIRKEGSAFDLPIAIAILASLGFIDPLLLKHTLIIGEMSLNGAVNPVKGILPIVMMAKNAGCKRCLVPKGNSMEGAAIQGIYVIGISTLEEAYSYLSQSISIEPEQINYQELLSQNHSLWDVDFSDINGQSTLRRGLEIAASGMHNIIMIGPPGSGKTMAAKRISTILPSLSLEESLEVSKIYSVSGLLSQTHSLLKTRPFISPHHTITTQALAGGGKIPRPGAVSLAHHGVLFLDELPEFQGKVLEILRQPLEDKVIHIARAKGNFTFPTNFMLVAALNPCPCGYYPDINKCCCSEYEIHRYLDKLSQPLLDRIDICMEAPRLEFKELHTSLSNESSRSIRERVACAHSLQKKRYSNTSYRFNSDLKAKDIKLYCALDLECEKLLETAFHRLNLTARGYHKTIKLARTIADLSGSKDITALHLSEAICYRMPDKTYWMR